MLNKLVNVYKQQTMRTWENKRFVPIGKNEERVINAFCKISTGLVSGREERKNRREGLENTTRLRKPVNGVLEHGMGTFAVGQNKVEK